MAIRSHEKQQATKQNTFKNGGAWILASWAYPIFPHFPRENVEESSLVKWKTIRNCRSRTELISWPFEMLSTPLQCPRTYANAGTNVPPKKGQPRLVGSVVAIRKKTSAPPDALFKRSNEFDSQDLNVEDMMVEDTKAEDIEAHASFKGLLRPVLEVILGERDVNLHKLNQNKELLREKVFKDLNIMQEIIGLSNVLQGQGEQVAKMVVDALCVLVDNSHAIDFTTGLDLIEQIDFADLKKLQERVAAADPAAGKSIKEGKRRKSSSEGSLMVKRVKDNFAFLLRDNQEMFSLVLKAYNNDRKEVKNKRRQNTVDDNLAKLQKAMKDHPSHKPEVELAFIMNAPLKKNRKFYPKWIDTIVGRQSWRSHRENFMRAMIRRYGGKEDQISTREEFFRNHGFDTSQLDSHNGNKFKFSINRGGKAKNPKTEKFQHLCKDCEYSLYEKNSTTKFSELGNFLLKHFTQTHVGRGRTPTFEPNQVRQIEAASTIAAMCDDTENGELRAMQSKFAEKLVGKKVSRRTLRRVTAKVDATLPNEVEEGHANSAALAKWRVWETIYEELIQKLSDDPSIDFNLEENPSFAKLSTVRADLKVNVDETATEFTVRKIVKTVGNNAVSLYGAPTNMNLKKGCPKGKVNQRCTVTVVTSGDGRRVWRSQIIVQERSVKSTQLYTRLGINEQLGYVCETANAFQTAKTWSDWVDKFVEDKVKHYGKDQWIVLLMDGHSSHLYAQQSQRKLLENRVIAVVLPGGTTNIFQPNDSGGNNRFKQLMSKYEKMTTNSSKGGDALFQRQVAITAALMEFWYGGDEEQQGWIKYFATGGYDQGLPYEVRQNPALVEKAGWDITPAAKGRDGAFQCAANVCKILDHYCTLLKGYTNACTAKVIQKSYIITGHAGTERQQRFPTNLMAHITTAKLGAGNSVQSVESVLTYLVLNVHTKDCWKEVKATVDLLRPELGHWFKQSFLKVAAPILEEAYKSYIPSDAMFVTRVTSVIAQAGAKKVKVPKKGEALSRGDMTKGGIIHYNDANGDPVFFSPHGSSVILQHEAKKREASEEKAQKKDHVEQKRHNSAVKERIDKVSKYVGQVVSTVEKTNGLTKDDFGWDKLQRLNSSVVQNILRRMNIVLGIKYTHDLGGNKGQTLGHVKELLERGFEWKDFESAARDFSSCNSIWGHLKEITTEVGGSLNLLKSISHRALLLGMTVCIDEGAWGDFCDGNLKELKLVPAAKNSSVEKLVEYFKALDCTVEESSRGSKKYTVSHFSMESTSASFSELDAVPGGGLRYSLNGFLCDGSADRLQIFSQGLGKGRERKVLENPAPKRKAESQNGQPAKRRKAPANRDLRWWNGLRVKGRNNDQYPYCWCRTQREGEQMIECENGESCPHGLWFHRECVGEPEVKEDEAWYCPNCSFDQLWGKHGANWYNEMLK